jgi:hypothetical protein
MVDVTNVVKRVHKRQVALEPAFEILWCHFGQQAVVVGVSARVIHKVALISHL